MVIGESTDRLARSEEAAHLPDFGVVHPEDKASRRLKRSAMLVEEIVRDIEENTLGILLDLAMMGNGVDSGDRFAFKEPVPLQLEIDARTGVVRLKAEAVLDYEQQKELRFTVLITREDSSVGE